jgi:hypothetical protein
VVYVATTPAQSAPAIDRMLFLWVGEVDPTATWAIPWAKNGTVPRPAGTGRVFAMIQEGNAGADYCEWLVATAADNWALVGGGAAACYGPLAGVFEGTVNLLTVMGVTAATVPAWFSYSALSFPTGDGTNLETADQTPACTTCDADVTPDELLEVHRARLLVGRVN